MRSSDVHCQRVYGVVTGMCLEKGLPPLPEPASEEAKTGASAAGKQASESHTEAKTSKPQGLSFSSGATAKGKGTKRKAVGDGRDDAAAAKTSKKKTKKPEKKLLSFDADA